MYRRYIKSLLDYLIALIVLPFVLLLMVIIAPAIYFNNPGPIFYNASRLGKNGKIFKMFKFRSMYVNAPDLRNEDGSTYNSEKDPRVTKIGGILRKTSMDELPQIFNILKGDMSFIGPRPGLPDTAYSSEEQKRRKVKPGITGFSQALFRNSDSMEERMRNDIYYVEHISFHLDIYILFMTVKSVVCRKNIYRN